MELCVPPGEKLDYKACESLEEVFKRVQFKVVDLEQTNLDEDVCLSTLFTLFPPLFSLPGFPLLSSIYRLSSTPSHYFFPSYVPVLSSPPLCFPFPPSLPLTGCLVFPRVV